MLRITAEYHRLQGYEIIKTNHWNQNMTQRDMEYTGLRLQESKVQIGEDNAGTIFGMSKQPVTTQVINVLQTVSLTSCFMFPGTVNLPPAKLGTYELMLGIGTRLPPVSGPL